MFKHTYTLVSKNNNNKNTTLGGSNPVNLEFKVGKGKKKPGDKNNCLA